MNESAVGRGSEWERGYNDRVREYETYEKEGKYECLSSVQGLLNYSHLKTLFLYRISYDMDKDTDRTASGLVPIDVPPATQRTRRGRWNLGADRVDRGRCARWLAECSAVCGSCERKRSD